MKKAILLSVLMALLVSAAFSQSRTDDEIISVAKKAALAQQDYDTITLEKLYSPDYIEISPKGEIDMRDKAIGFYRVDDVEKAKATTPKYILDEFKVRNYKNFAIVITRFSVGSKSDSQQKPTAVGLVVYALRKEKGAWKIYSSQFTPFPPPPRPLPKK